MKLKQWDMLPTIKYSMKELALVQLFDTYVTDESGAEIGSSQIVCMMITNTIHMAKPLYQAEDWAHNYMDGIMGDEGIRTSKLNDDRLGHNIDRLFKADCASLLTEL